MNKLTRRDVLDLIARGGLACGGCCALSRFAVLDALAADADDAKAKSVDNGMCVRCFDCLGACGKGAIGP